MGFVGCANAGSSRDTTDWVTTATTGRFDTAPRQLVGQRFDEHEADGALRIADRVIARERSTSVCRDLGSAQDEADLRTVAVRDDDVPAGVDHVDDAESPSRTRRRTDRRAPYAASSRISALPPTATTAICFIAACDPVAQAPTTAAAVKHAMGAVVMPAPICPTPASRCAMPLLMTGRMPRSSDLARVDAGGGRREVERGQRERRIAAERDRAHAQAVGDARRPACRRRT